MSNTEKIGIGWLENKIGESKILETYFRENDKTPSWDGYLFLYDSAIKKENFYETIPVQIKSVVVKSFSNVNSSLSLDKVDLQNYYKIKGTIIFLNEICEQNRKTFIKSLLPSDLKALLSGLEKEGGENQTIHLDELDFTTMNQVESVCKHFVLHRLLQYSTIEHSLTLEEASEINIPLIIDENQDERQLFYAKHLLYGKRSKDSELCYINNIEIIQVSKPINGNVSINDKVYYSTFNEQRTSSDLIFEFGNKVIVNITNGNLSYKLAGKIREQINDLAFILDFFQVGVIEIGTGKLEVTHFNDDAEFLSKTKKTLEILQSIEKLLDIFDLESDLLITSNLENDEIINLEILVKYFVYKHKIDSIPFQLGFNGVKIGNITLGIYVYKNTYDDNFTILNLFKDMGRVVFEAKMKNNVSIRISPYIFLTSSFLTTVSNLNLNEVVNNIKLNEFTEEYGNAINQFGLELIKAYDNSKREEFINIAKNLFEWLKEKQEKSPIILLNLLQIHRRFNSFSENEIIELDQLREEMHNKNDNRMLCGINILLENKTDAQKYFNKLNNDEKKEFCDFPIFSLAKHLGIFDN